MIWTTRQRGIWIAVIAAVWLILLARYWQSPRVLSDPMPVVGSLAVKLDARIDPNIADLDTLAALPSIGPAMAGRIIEDREQWLAENPGMAAYRKLSDLKRVRGIGEATIGHLEPYLRFPEAQHPRSEIPRELE